MEGFVSVQKDRAMGPMQFLLPDASHSCPHLEKQRFGVSKIRILLTPYNARSGLYTAGASGVTHKGDAGIQLWSSMIF